MLKNSAEVILKISNSKYKHSNFVCNDHFHWLKTYGVVEFMYSHTNEMQLLKVALGKRM